MTDNRHERRKKAAQLPKQKAKTLIDPKVDAPILNANKSQSSDEATLDTGMTVKEAVAQAAFWWENIGRQLMRDRNEGTDNPGYGSFTANPKTTEEADNWVPSGILEAKSWDDLNKKEKLTITKHWHHNNVRVPNIDPEEYERAMKQAGKCFYCDNDATADEVMPNGEPRELCWSHFMDRYPEEAKAVFVDKLGTIERDY